MIFIKKIGAFLVSKTFLISLLAMLLFWVILIVSSLSYFDSYTKHGEQIEVPVLASKNKSELVNVAQLDQLLKDKSLSYEVLDSIYNPNLVEGTVVYQDPLPTIENGQFVKSGRVIKVRVSKQSRQVTVPILIDKSQRYAEGMLTTLGLRSKAKYVPSDVNGSVLEISYKGKPVKHGQKLPVNAIVELTIGKNTGGTLVSVPDLNGLTIFEAESRFKNNNALNLYISCAQCLTSSDSLNARIMSQTPIAGDSSLVPQGTTITAFASLGIEDSTY